MGTANCGTNSEDAAYVIATILNLSSLGVNIIYLTYPYNVQFIPLHQPNS